MASMINIYEAPNSAVAEMIHEELTAHDIRAEVDQIPNPLDGLTAMGQGVAIFVMDDQADRAREVIHAWLAANPEQHDSAADEQDG